MGLSLQLLSQGGGRAARRTTVVGLRLERSWLRGNAPGSAVSPQEEPIKRTVSSGVIWRARQARRS